MRRNIGDTSAVGLVTTTDYLGHEELVRRLRDGELEEDCNRLRRFFFRQWAALHELYLSPEADPSKLDRWRSAPAHSPAARKAHDHDRAIRTLLLWEAMRRPTPGG